jgi:lysozyme
MNLLKIPVHPKSPREEIEKIISGHNIQEKVVIVGIRGYNGGSNERGIYDDALFIVSPSYFNAYNANTDPSVTRPGIAVLQPGVYQYRKGLHGVSGPHPYIALRQASNVVVIRDGMTEPETDSPENRFWIDIHRGGYGTTSSLGCQTIHPDQWSNFRDNIFNEMDKAGQILVPYLLTIPVN